MLDHLGERAATARLMTAVELVCEAGVLTPDLGGKARTADVTRAVCAALHGNNAPAGEAPSGQARGEANWNG